MAILGSMFWMTRDELLLAGIDLERDLTIVPQVWQLPELDENGEELPLPEVEAIQQWTERRRVGIPIAFGLDKWGDRPLEERLSHGSEIPIRCLPDPTNPKAAPGQAQFFDDVLNAARNEYVVLAEAPTGSGKTVTLLNTIGELARTAVVIVPSNVLANQWAEEAKQHLGMIDDEIGFVREDKCDWQGKSLVIVVLHNLFLKSFSNDFYSYFGIAAFDEVHNLGAREFSKAMHCFPAAYKLAVSATPDRRDGCAAVFKNYFGEVIVKSEQEALPITCYALPFFHPYVPQWLASCRATTKPLLWLSRHEKRNRKIVKLACKHYDQGRHILILTKFIDHAELLIKQLIEEGVPAEEIGQFTGEETVEGLKNRRKVSQARLNEIKASCFIIVATYSMIKEGVDIPRIDVGIEALPVADARQAIGRARRPLPGKPRPKWFSIKDTGFRPGSGLEFLYNFTSARLRGFENVGVDIEHVNTNRK